MKNQREMRAFKKAARKSWPVYKSLLTEENRDKWAAIYEEQLGE